MAGFFREVDSCVATRGGYPNELEAKSRNIGAIAVGTELPRRIFPSSLSLLPSPSTATSYRLYLELPRVIQQPSSTPRLPYTSLQSLPSHPSFFPSTASSSVTSLTMGWIQRLEAPRTPGASRALDNDDLRPIPKERRTWGHGSSFSSSSTRSSLIFTSPRQSSTVCSGGQPWGTSPTCMLRLLLFPPLETDFSSFSLQVRRKRLAHSRVLVLGGFGMLYRWLRTSSPLLLLSAA